MKTAPRRQVASERTSALARIGAITLSLSAIVLPRDLREAALFASLCLVALLVALLQQTLP